MKKVVTLVLLVALFTTSVFAVSYKNNTYQKLANEYTKKAEIAMDAGQYEDAIEYSKLAEENAELSKAFIAAMTEKGNASNSIALARKK